MSEKAVTVAQSHTQTDRSMNTDEIEIKFLQYAGTTPQDMAINECPFCASQSRPTLVDGILSCVGCCTILDRVMDYGAEWRIFQGDNNRSDTSRCSIMISDLITPLGCVIRAGGHGGSGQRSKDSRAGLSAVMMSKHQGWNALTYRERSLCKVFEVINCRTSIHNIAPCIVYEAKHMYKQVSHGRVFRGELRKSVVAACVYMALRSSHAPRSISEVARMFDLTTRTTMVRACNLFHSVIPRQMDSSETADFVARFGGKVGMTAEQVQTCKTLAKRVDASYLVSDCTPPSIAGAIIYLVNRNLDLGIKRQEIADACLVSSGTIARCCRRIVLHDSKPSDE